MKKLVAILMAMTYAMTFLPTVKAASPTVVEIGSSFVIAYFMKNDQERASTYLSENVTIPEIREETPINRVTGLPSPEENVSVVVTYFEDERNPAESGRIAFIWEILFEEDKITDIRVIYDGANPYSNESKLINEFERKSKSNILAQNNMPFEITHIDGNVSNENLEINYRNTEMEASLQIRVEKNNSPLETFQDNEDQYYTLRNGLKAIYKPNTQLIFQNNNLLYSIRLVSEENETFQLDDYLKIANTMNYR